MDPVWDREIRLGKVTLRKNNGASFPVFGSQAKSHPKPSALQIKARIGEASCILAHPLLIGPYKQCW